MTDTADSKRDFFVSFNQADRAWATWIAWVLEEAGYSVFFQDWDFRGNFVEHMNRSHVQAYRTLAVLSDNYFGSDFTLAEWSARFAQDPAAREDRLVPVKVGPLTGETILSPIVHADLTGCEEAEAHRRLLARVKQAVDATYRPKPPTCPGFPGLARQVPQKPRFPALGRLHNVPTLPPNYVPRAKQLDQLKRAILSTSSKPVGITGRPVREGLWGMSGIGKSVLAAALARDNEVQKTFLDGVIWLSFGRQAEPTIQQANLIAALGAPGSTFTSWQQGLAAISNATFGRSCLIILDDVWEPEHAIAFSQFDERCRMLVTTRDFNVLLKIDAREHQLDPLPEVQALALLARSAGKMKRALPSEALALAKECGYLPLTLAALGTSIKVGELTWSKALNELRYPNHKYLWNLRIPHQSYEHRNTFQALKVSVNALSIKAKKAFRFCAVFPEAVAIPEDALITLWQSVIPGSSEVSKIAQILVERCLINRDEERRYRLHDLYYDYLQATSSSSHVRELHRKVINCYGAFCSYDWPSGRNDGYFFQRLTWHLVQAGDTETVSQLCFNYRWLQAKLCAAGPTALLEDFAFLPNNNEAKVVASAIQLSSHALARDSRQLAPQLVGRIPRGHESNVKKLLFDAKKFAYKPSLLPIDPSLAKSTRSFTSHFLENEDWVTALAVAPDEERVLTASEDRTLRLWDLKTNKELRRLEGHESWIYAIVVTPDGRRALSASHDWTLRYWDLESGEQIRSFVHKNRVTAVAITSNGEQALSASDDRLIHLWNLSAGEEIHLRNKYGKKLCPFEGHEGHINVVI